MSMILNHNNVVNLLVGRNVARTAALAVNTNPQDFVSTLTTGEMFVINAKTGNMLDASSVTGVTHIKIGVKSTDGTIIWSDTIEIATVSNYTGRTAARQAEQVGYFGYNGTSGSIEVLNNNTYSGRFTFYGDTQLDSATQVIKHWAYITSDSSDTQTTIAKGIAENMIANFSLQREKDVKISRVYSGAITEFITPAAFLGSKWVVTKGSKYITLLDSAGAVAVHGLTTVGEIINLAGRSFVVDEIPADTSMLKLDLPWTDESGIVVVGNDGAAETLAIADAQAGVGAGVRATFTATPLAGSIGSRAYFYVVNGGSSVLHEGTVITSKVVQLDTAAATGSTTITGSGVQAAGGNWGVKMTGVAREFAAGRLQFSKSNWYFSAENYGTTTITASTAASKGYGAYEAIAEQEWVLQGNNGNIYRNDVSGPIIPMIQLTELNRYYSTISFNFYHDMQSDLGVNVRSLKQLVLALRAPYNDINATAFYSAGTTDNATYAGMASATVTTSISDATLGVMNALNALFSAAQGADLAIATSSTTTVGYI